ncbi:hypothetical protein D3C73_1595110 [compost metagenome]
MRLLSCRKALMTPNAIWSLATSIAVISGCLLNNSTVFTQPLLALQSPYSVSVSTMPA